MRFLATKILILSAIIIIPATAHADWFGVGAAVGKISDAVWKSQLIQAIKQTLPSLILLTAIIGAIASAAAAANLAMRLHDSARVAMADNRITPSEWIILLVLTIVTVPVVVGLLWFGWFLALASRSGLLELMG